MRRSRMLVLLLAVLATGPLTVTMAHAQFLTPTASQAPSHLRRCGKNYDEEEFAAMIDSGEDGYEPDDCPLLASSLTGPQGHNFCQLGDEDWAVFRAKSGLIYQVKAESPSNYPTEPHLDLFDNGEIIAQNDHYFGNDAEIWFWNDGPERLLYVRTNELEGRADCGNSSYTLSLRAFTDKP